jgi:hypothetical protein
VFLFYPKTFANLRKELQQNNQQMLESVAVIFKKASDHCVIDKKS